MAEQKRIAAALGLDGLGEDARGIFDLAAGLGYGGVGIPTNHKQLQIKELGESGVRHLKAILEGRRLTVDAVRTAVPRGGLGDAKTIDRTVENAREAIRMARRLGAGTVSLDVGTLGSGGSDGAAQVVGGSIVMAARELAEEAEAAGITLALGAGDSEKLLDLIGVLASSRVRANLETGRLGSAKPLMALGKMAGAVGQWTAADAVRGRMVALGEGQTPLEEVLQVLWEQGFTGPVVVDVRDLADGRAGARRAAEVLGRLLGRGL